MNLFNIERQFKLKKEKNWDKLYWCIDLHDVIIEGTHTKFNEGKQFYPFAKEVLQWISRRQDMVLILWSSSFSEPLAEIIDWLADYGIFVEYVNENPECETTELCDFSKKFYFNILLDDKAGFEGKTDWFLIKKELDKLGEWNR